MLDHSYQQMWLICLNMGQIFYKPWASSMVCLKTNLLHLSMLYAVWYSSSYNRNCHRCLGRYVIFVAFMSVMSSLDTPVLLDYVQPAVATVDSGMFRTVVIEIFFCIDLCCQYFHYDLNYYTSWLTIILMFNAWLSPPFCILLNIRFWHNWGAIANITELSNKVCRIVA